MRVLHLTTEYPPIIYGGLGTAIGGLVEASARSGLEVGVLLIGETGLAAYGQQAQSNESTAVQTFALPQGVRIFPTPWGAAADYALRLVRRWRPDVIHLHVFWLWGIAKQLQEMTGIPLVYTVHSLDVAEYQLGGGPTQCLDQWPIQQAVLEGADLIIAPSRSEGDLVGQYSPGAIGKVRVVGHGIDDRQERRGFARSPSTVPTVLFVGRFVDRKGIRELLCAIPSVLEVAPQARFVLIGGHRGTSGAEMEGWWLSPELAPFRDQVRFTGWLPPTEVASWCRTADILVVPSWYEPFGMVVLEGMLEGMAVAAADVGGPGEILEHERTGLLFAPRDAGSLAGALARLILDPRLRQRLGSAAAEDVRRRWLWSSAVAATRVVYEEAVARSPVTGLRRSA